MAFSSDDQIFLGLRLGRRHRRISLVRKSAYLITAEAPREFLNCLGRQPLLPRAASWTLGSPSSNRQREEPPLGLLPGFLLRGDRGAGLAGEV